MFLMFVFWKQSFDSNLLSTSCSCRHGLTRYQRNRPGTGWRSINKRILDFELKQTTAGLNDKVCELLQVRKK